MIKFEIAQRNYRQLFPSKAKKEHCIDNRQIPFSFYSGRIDCRTELSNLIW